MTRLRRVALQLATSLLFLGCAGMSAPVTPVTPVTPVATVPAPRPAIDIRADAALHPLASSTQLVVVTTATWDTTGGTLQRYERGTTAGRWRPVGSREQIVVGRTGLAWDDGLRLAADTPVKREGDGRAPAGVFVLDTVFGFAPREGAGWIRLPYLPVTAQTECVDDVRSVHYNTVVYRGGVSSVDWTSSEPMRRIEEYRLGVIVGYNVPPVAGRGSCIFLHIWAGAGIGTEGCTAMPERVLTELVLWLDRARRPTLVQLPEREYARLRDSLALP